MPNIISTSFLPSFFELGDEVAIANRQALHESNVLAVNVLGTPGCGKTCLLRSTAAHLRPEIHAAVVSSTTTPTGGAQQAPRRDPYHGKGVVSRATAEPGHVHDALASLDLADLDVLFIESRVTTAADIDADLGQDLRVAVFNSSEGPDEPARYPDMVAKADAIVLNRIPAGDPAATFDFDRFYHVVRRQNPTARIFDLSAHTSEGFGPWLDWLRARVPNPREQVSNWFG